jgi:hypothetical protein
MQAKIWVRHNGMYLFCWISKRAKGYDIVAIYLIIWNRYKILGIVTSMTYSISYTIGIIFYIIIYNYIYIFIHHWKSAIVEHEHCYLLYYPLVMTNIAMENGPFIDGLPIKNGDCLKLCYLPEGICHSHTTKHDNWTWLCPSSQKDKTHVHVQS